MIPRLKLIMILLVGKYRKNQHFSSGLVFLYWRVKNIQGSGPMFLILLHTLMLTLLAKALPKYRQLHIRIISERLFRKQAGCFRQFTVPTKQRKVRRLITSLVFYCVSRDPLQNIPRINKRFCPRNSFLLYFQRELPSLH